MLRNDCMTLCNIFKYLVAVAVAVAVIVPSTSKCVSIKANQLLFLNRVE